jgi:hypothetical protein
MNVSRKMLPSIHRLHGKGHTKESAMMVFKPAMAMLAALHLWRRMIWLAAESRGPETTDQ